MPIGRLKNKVVLLTGACGLLGGSFCRAILEEGGKVVALDLRTEDLLEMKSTISVAHAASFYALAVDLTDEVALGNALSELPPSFRPNCLVNNAAINPKVEDGELTDNSIESISKFRWEFELGVGLWGAFSVSRAFSALLSRGDSGGSIVNIGSDYAHLAPNQGLYLSEGTLENPAIKPVTYSVMKHGVIGLTRYLAAYWAGASIRVNTLSPGGILNNQSSAFKKSLSTQVPLGRLADVEELKGALIFLLSDESSYMNGAEVVIDGGRAIW